MGPDCRLYQQVIEAEHSLLHWPYERSSTYDIPLTSVVCAGKFMVSAVKPTADSQIVAKDLVARHVAF
jgi:hypothetical protein